MKRPKSTLTIPVVNESRFLIHCDQEPAYKQRDGGRTGKAMHEPYNKGSQPLVNRPSAEAAIDGGERSLTEQMDMFISFRTEVCVPTQVTRNNSAGLPPL